jgi:hypothetical protein
MFTTSRLFIPILLSFAVVGCFCLPNLKKCAKKGKKKLKEPRNLQVRHFVLVVSRMRIAFDRRVGCILLCMLYAYG